MMRRLRQREESLEIHAEPEREPKKFASMCGLKALALVGDLCKRIEPK